MRSYAFRNDKSLTFDNSSPDVRTEPSVLVNFKDVSEWNKEKSDLIYRHPSVIKRPEVKLLTPHSS